MDRLNHPPRSYILKHILPWLSLSGSLLAVNTREALGLCFILMKHLERTYWDLVGGIAKHSPKIWLGTVPGCSVSDLEGEDFSHVLCTGFALLLWSQLPPPHTESFKSPSLGFWFSCCQPCYQSGEWGSPRKSRGIEEEELIPALLSPVSPREVLSLVGKGFKGSLLLC